MGRERKYVRVKVADYKVISNFDVAEPEPECGHYAQRLLWPWEAGDVIKAAKAAGKKPQTFCKVCRLWVRFDAWPPFRDGQALV